MAPPVATPFPPSEWFDNSANKKEIGPAWFSANMLKTGRKVTCHSTKAMSSLAERNKKCGIHNCKWKVGHRNCEVNQASM